MMKNLIRCNNCYVRANATKEPFTLTQCRHIYCNRCIKSAERQCPICNTVNVPTLCLQEPLEPNAASYFMSLSDQIQNLLSIAKFQEEQIQISSKRSNELDARYAYYKELSHKLEIGTLKWHKKCKQDREEYAKRLCILKNENIRLKLALENAEGGSPFGNYHNNTAQSRVLNSSNLQHTCSKRFEQNVTKVSFSTPLSTNSNTISDASSGPGRTYLSSIPGLNGNFQIPNTHKVPKSAGTRSSASTSSTLSNMFPRRMRLDS